LFLNPPYGDVVADKAQTGQRAGGDRLEKVFFRKTLSLLQFRGVLVLIVPYTVIDAEFAGLIARNFDNVQVFMAPERRFKQCVVFGTKKRADAPSAAVVKTLVSFAKAEGVDLYAPERELPEHWPGEPYVVPQQTEANTFGFTVLRIEGQQLADELTRFAEHTLWPQLANVFSVAERENRPPLCALSQWHLALALASGQGQRPGAKP